MRPGDYVCLSVSDTGTGISADHLEKVMEPFYTTKDVGKGSGLGLSMVYGFAKQSNGAFRLQSKVGEGTTAEIWLPRAPRNDDARRRTAKHESRSPRLSASSRSCSSTTIRKFARRRPPFSRTWATASPSSQADARRSRRFGPGIAIMI